MKKLQTRIKVSLVIIHCKQKVIFIFLGGLNEIAIDLE